MADEDWVAAASSDSWGHLWADKRPLYPQKRTLCSAAVEPAPGALAVTGNVDYGVDDDTGRDGDQVRYEAEVDA